MVFGDSSGQRPKGPSTGRIVIWIVVGAIGVYLVVSGVIGIITSS